MAVSSRRLWLGAALVSTLALVPLAVSCYRLGGACSPVRLVLGPDRFGQLLYRRGDYAQAAETFVDPAWQAAALFRAGEFERAAGLYAGIPGADASFNAGNALVLQGEYAQAVQRYEQALAQRPGWTAAEANRAIAAGRAARLELEGGDMTGGMLGADEIVFGDGGSDDQGQRTEVAGGAASDAEMRAIWLRQVQTRPADFLRVRFAYEQATRSAPGGAD